MLLYEQWKNIACIQTLSESRINVKILKEFFFENIGKELIEKVIKN